MAALPVQDSEAGLIVEWKDATVYLPDWACQGPDAVALLSAIEGHLQQASMQLNLLRITWMYSRATSGSMLEAMTALPSVVGPQCCCSASHAINLCLTSHLLAACVLTATSLCSKHAASCQSQTMPMLCPVECSLTAKCSMLFVPDIPSTC